MEIDQKELDRFMAENAKATAKSKAESSEARLKIKNNQNYLIVAIIMVVQLGLSMLNLQDGKIVLNFPQDAMGWTVFVGTKVITSILAFMIFTMFMDEGKKLGKASENYKQAQDILLSITGKESKIKVESPKEYTARIMTTKGVKLILSCIFSLVALSGIVLNPNIGTIAGTVLSLLFAFIYGTKQRDDTEDYYTNGYLLYATVLKTQYDNKQKELNDKGESKICLL